MRPDYCPLPDEDTPEGQKPCLACGATIEGKDPVRGICQARFRGPPPTPLLQIVLTDKHTGKII